MGALSMFKPESASMVIWPVELLFLVVDEVIEL